MKNLYHAEDAESVKARVIALTPENERLWGKMSAPQALAHCAITVEWALGESHPRRMFIGRLLGGTIKRKVVADDGPFGKNSPTAPELVMVAPCELKAEQARLSLLIDRFQEIGPAGCTDHPHPFFGAMTPDEWAILLYKHLDHHLRQFGG